MNKYDRIIWFLWIAISIFVSFLSLDVGVGTFSEPGPGLFPFVFAIILGGASIFHLIHFHFKQVQKGGGQIKFEKYYLKRPVLIILFLIIYSLVLSRIGYLVSTFILLFILFAYAVPGSKREWKIAVIGSISVAIFSYIIFGKILQIMLPRGILGF